MAKNPISIEVLEILDAIDRRGSFAKASEELNKATSALSYAIQKLEEQLGITIFQRQGRRSVLTPSGRFVLDEGRNILNASHYVAEKAKELATGWEPRIRIALDSLLNYEVFFQALAEFLEQYPSIEFDISECVLNGGWDALEQNRVDLIIGVPGPAPLHKGFRTQAIKQSQLLPVISAKHPLAYLAQNKQALEEALPNLRRVVSHDTSLNTVLRSAGLSTGKQIIYTQTIDQKLQAQLAGLGIGHLPLHRIKKYLDSGELLALNLQGDKSECFMAWKMDNKGKALQNLTKQLASLSW